MSDSWKNYKLGEILILLTDYHANGAYEKLKANVTLLDSSDYAIMIRTKNFEQNSFANDLKYIDKHAYNYLSKSKVYPGDLIMNKIANPGTVYFMPDLRRPVSLAMNLFLLRINSSIANQFYVYNYLRLHEDYVKSFSAGTAAKTITKDAVRNLDIILPPLPEQQAIAEILSALDEKIELNLKMNKTLEEMANTLYKHWFVDFGPFINGKFIESELGMIPEGWEVKKLEDVVEFINGYAFKSSDLLDYQEGDCYSVFKMGNIKKGGGLKPDGTKSYVKKESADKLDKYILKKGDLLMSMTDMKDKVTILGHTALMNEDNKFIVNQRVGLLRLRNVNGISSSFLYILTNYYEFLNDLRSKANSGVQVNLSTESIKSAKFISATKDLNNRFNDLISPMFEQIFSITKENEILAQTRDYLLPKLISGEIRVKDAAKAVKEIV